MKYELKGKASTPEKFLVTPILHTIINIRKRTKEFAEVRRNNPEDNSSGKKKKMECCSKGVRNMPNPVWTANFSNLGSEKQTKCEIFP